MCRKTLNSIAVLFSICLMCISCTSSNTVQTTTSTSSNSATGITENVVELYIPSYSNKAIIFVNTNPDSTASSQEVDNLPLSRTRLLSSILSSSDQASRWIKDFHKEDVQKGSMASRITSAISSQFSVSHTTLTHTFISTNLITNRDKNVSATLQYGTASTRCLIYVEDGQEGDIDWNVIGNVFDNTIYPRVTDKFGTPLDVDGNDQIVILYSTFESDTIVGFFWSGDLFSGSSSNQMELLYMNILAANYPTLNYQTMAHEFQHLTNASVVIRDGHYSYMETWLNEGLAEAAADYALDAPIEEHIQAIQNSNTIAEGLSVIDWIGSVDNYTLAYLFSEYLKNLATSGVDIFLKMIEYNGDANEQVEAGMSGENATLSTIEEFLAYFRIANIAQSDGIYGYGNEQAEFTFESIPAPDSYTATVNLDSGGSIVIYPSDADFDSYLPNTIGSDVQVYKLYGDQ